MRLLTKVDEQWQQDNETTRQRTLRQPRNNIDPARLYWKENAVIDFMNSLQEPLHFHVETIHSGHGASIEKVKDNRMPRLEKLKSNYMKKVDYAPQKLMIDTYRLRPRRSLVRTNQV